MRKDLGPDFGHSAVTITNRNLGAIDSAWSCQPLKRVELTARAIYYITRALRYFE